MLCTWPFSLLLLGSVLGSPLFHNRTKNSTSDHVVPPHAINPQDNSSNSVVGCEGPSCGSSHNYTVLDTADGCEGPSCGSSHNYTVLETADMQSPTGRLSLLESHSRGQILPQPYGGCLLPTCALHHLSEKLQSGDEKAGDTSDPYGVGKR
ncbi:uncharacterized protein zgc:193726 [Astyanax mexicanus]|uniref:uncharacterized protein zgc:193726 n=1 Tax=Astyanax mexicanus TaxID=7994 RepID=UPI0020CAFF31|nr:uncharacterized protein zgc:193726 [Astyanax mexicanus]